MASGFSGQFAGEGPANRPPTTRGAYEGFSRSGASPLIPPLLPLSEVGRRLAPYLILFASFAMSVSSPSPPCQPSSIGKKVVMALSGLVLVGFVLGHMMGNLLMFKGPEAINAYAAWLHANPGLLWGARVVMIISTIAHIWAGILLSLENRAARAGGPAVDATRRATFASRSMPYSGLIIMGFAIFHLLHFTFRAVALGDVSFGGDVYKMVVAGFTRPLVAYFYIVSLLLLCLHLSHGVSSVFQTLGLRNERWRSRLDGLALAYGWLIALGFISIPLAVLTGYLK
ncbi:MAG: succinate:quinone oxidoreductase [Opitutia bacterium]|nr:succinate dehydrogenase cytochrome b subunit [Opitutales bacterium]PHX79690.1 MAG: succinate:quinone oxidoreductase [Opitutae bacterium]